MLQILVCPSLRMCVYSVTSHDFFICMRKLCHMQLLSEDMQRNVHTDQLEFPFCGAFRELSDHYLDHIHVRRAAGHRVVHLPHLPISFNSNQFDGNCHTSTSENRRVHHLCVLKQTEKKFISKKLLSITNYYRALPFMSRQTS